MGGLNGKVFSLIMLLSLLALFAIVPLVHARNYTVLAGGSAHAQVSFCLNGAGGNSHVEASAGGAAESWVSPSYFDFGEITAGSCPVGNYIISAPPETPSGNYALDWYGTCQNDNGNDCYPFIINETIHVLGSEPVTTEYTTSATTTIPPGGCGPLETVGGLPSSVICYPSDMRMAKSGSASVVDLSDMETDTFTVGDIAWVKADSSVTVSAPELVPGYSLSLGPDTLGAMIQVLGNPTSGFSSAEDQYPSYYQTFDDEALNFGMHISSALITHTVMNHLLLLAGLGELTTTIVSAPTAMVEVGHGEIHLKENTLHKANWEADILSSPQVGVLLKGTNVTMNVTGNGTTLTVFTGSVLVDSLAVNGPTLKYITLNAGQQLFVPSNSIQANQQNLTSSVKTFTLSTTSTIYQSTNSTAPSITIAGMSETQTIVTLFIFVMIIIIALRLYRQRKK